MQLTANDIIQLTRQAEVALRQGNATQARQHFERIVASGKPDVPVLLGLAHSCAVLQDRKAAEWALDSALAQDPRNLHGLIMKGDLVAARGDTKGAAAFYMTAVKSAASYQHVPPDLQDELLRAEAFCTRTARDLEAGLQDHLARLGRGSTLRSVRFDESLDILLGKKRIYNQQPRYYHFPGLANIAFLDREQFPWMEELEAETANIRSELLQVLQTETAFKPYVEAHTDRPFRAQDGMLNNPEWSAFYLWKNGELIEENAARCPATVRALAKVPLASVKNRSPSVLFSLLRPGAHIPPHHGLVNTRVICHLPLIIPDGCLFRVGNDCRPWVTGKAWAFDDTIEHEAWNNSDQTRVILLFEVWRPELTADERQLVTGMFDAIDAQGGRKPAWEI